MTRGKTPVGPLEEKDQKRRGASRTEGKLAQLRHELDGKEEAPPGEAYPTTRERDGGGVVGDRTTIGVFIPITLVTGDRRRKPLTGGNLRVE